MTTTTTTTPKVAVNHRAFFRAALDGLSYDNASRAEAKAAVVAVVPAGASPAQWVQRARHPGGGGRSPQPRA